MSKFDREWPCRLGLVAVFLVPGVMLGWSTRAQVKPSPQEHKRMVQAVDKTLKEGLHAKLPPHLSTLLGLSQEQECLVRQGVVRTGEVVQGFDVSMANENDVVLFVANETTNAQTLYLTSSQGALRRVVTVEDGVGRVQKVTGEARKAFEKEKQFWLQRLSPLVVPKH